MCQHACHWALKETQEIKVCDCNIKILLLPHPISSPYPLNANRQLMTWQNIAVALVSSKLDYANSLAHLSQILPNVNASKTVLLNSH